jgi:predicted LPLAT superfamily acyltransferase
MSIAWFAEPERGSPAAMRFLTWLVLRLGRRATRWLLYPLSLYYLAFAPRARRASRVFLRRALGRNPGLGDVLRHFHTYAATLHDRIFLLCGRFESLEVTVDGAAPLDDIIARGRGCILLGSHLGSFEAVRALGRLVKNYPINLVMYEGNAQKLTAVIDRLAPDLKARIIVPGLPETMLRIKECLERGEIVGMLGDRPFGSDKNTVCPFLGVPARFPQGPFRLAMVLEAPVVLFFGLYQGGNRYRVALEPLAAQPATGRDERSAAAARWIERYVLRLEHFAREAPYNWFNFYDFWDENRS